MSRHRYPRELRTRYCINCALGFMRAVDRFKRDMSREMQAIVIPVLQLEVDRLCAAHFPGQEPLRLLLGGNHDAP